MPNQYPAAGSRKTVLRGTILIGTTSTSQTATIPSVDTTKADLRLLGFRANSGSGVVASDHVTLVLTNATTITADRISNASGVQIAVSWELTVWY